MFLSGRRVDGLDQRLSQQDSANRAILENILHCSRLYCEDHLANITQYITEKLMKMMKLPVSQYLKCL